MHSYMRMSERLCLVCGWGGYCVHMCKYILWGGEIEREREREGVKKVIETQYLLSPPSPPSLLQV